MMPFQEEDDQDLRPSFKDTKKEKAKKKKKRKQEVSLTNLISKLFSDDITSVIRNFISLQVQLTNQL